MRFVLLLLVFLVFAGCGRRSHAVSVEVEALKQEIVKLKTENAGLVGKVATLVKPDDVQKVINDNSKLMYKFQALGMFIMGLSVIATIILWKIAAPLRFIGYAGFAGGAVWYYLSLSNSIIASYLPYFLLLGLGVLFVGAVIYLIRRIDWTPDEKEGVREIVSGNFDGPMAQKLLKELFPTRESLEKLQKLREDSAVAPTVKLSVPTGR